MDSSSPDPSAENYDESRSKSILPELLIRPLGNNYEWRHALKADLEERIEHARPEPEDDSPGTAVAWLESHPLPSALLRRRGLVPLAIAAMLLTLASLGLALWKAIPALAVSTENSLLMDAAFRQFYDLPPSEAPYDSFLDSESSEAFAAERAWRAHPNDPVPFFAYATAQPSGELPPDYTAQWQRLDPDNGFWLTWEAFQTMPALAKSPTPIAPADRARFLDLLRQAAEKPRWQSYRTDRKAYVGKHALSPPSYFGDQASSARHFPTGYALAFHDNVWSFKKALPADFESINPLLKERMMKEIEEIEGLDYLSGTLFPTPDPKLMTTAAATAGIAAGSGLLGLAFYLASAIAALRLRPNGGLPGLMLTCLAPLLRTRDLVFTLAWALVPALLLAGLRYAFWRGPNFGDFLKDGPGFMVAMAPAILLTMVVASRATVSGRTAFAGMRGGHSGGSVIVWMTLGLWVAAVVVFLASPSVFSTSHPGIFGIVAVLATPGLLWLPGRFLLGYASPQANVRHRLIALQLVPVLLIASIVFSLLSLALHPLEMHAVAGR